MRRVYRHAVPADGYEHRHMMSGEGEIVHVDTRKPEIVEFWYISDGSDPKARSFKVFATGQELPDEAKYIGTALIPGGGELVWHLFEMMPKELRSITTAEVTVGRIL